MTYYQVHWRRKSTCGECGEPYKWSACSQNFSEIRPHLSDEIARVTCEDCLKLYRRFEAISGGDVESFLHPGIT